jgi:hypothetical protein
MINGTLPESSARRLRHIARILIAAIIALTLFMTLSHIFFPEPTDENYPWIENLLPILMLLNVLGLAVAFRWESLGGLLRLFFSCCIFCSPGGSGITSFQQRC